MWKAAVKDFYLQFLQWLLLKSRQPRSLSAPSCFDHVNEIGGKCWVTSASDIVVDEMKSKNTTTKLTYDATKNGRRLI